MVEKVIIKKEEFYRHVIESFDKNFIDVLSKFRFKIYRREEYEAYYFSYVSVPWIFGAFAKGVEKIFSSEFEIGVLFCGSYNMHKGYVYLVKPGSFIAEVKVLEDTVINYEKKLDTITYVFSTSIEKILQEFVNFEKVSKWVNIVFETRNLRNVIPLISESLKDPMKEHVKNIVNELKSKNIPCTYTLEEGKVPTLEIMYWDVKATFTYPPAYSGIIINYTFDILSTIYKNILDESIVKLATFLIISGIILG